LAAEVKVPVGSAAVVRIKYGKNPLSLDLTTTDQPINGSEALVLMTGLDAATTYAYEVVRTDRSGKIVSSAPGTFQTLGYVIAAHFVDNKNKGIQGIPAKLNIQEGEKRSDNDGNVSFSNVPEGSHTLTYTYRDKEYTKLVTASSATVSPAEAAAARVITLDHTIDVQEAVNGAAVAPEAKRESSLAGLLIALGIGLLAIVLVVAGYIVQRKRRQAAEYYDNSPAPPLPEYKPLAPASNVPPAVRPPEAVHMGESLKDMVLRSMAEEARRREQSDRNDLSGPKQ
jgi:hypothetical protein